MNQILNKNNSQGNYYNNFNNNGYSFNNQEYYENPMYYQNNMNGGYGNFNPNRNKNNLLKIFIIILVIVTIIVSVFVFIKVKNTNKEIKSLEELREKIIVNITEDSGKVSLDIDSINSIDKIVYTWNNETEKEGTINAENKNKLVDKSIDIPYGKNNFSVSITDSKGNNKKFEKDFESQTGKDIENPKITIVSNSGIIQVDANDNLELDKVEYAWSGTTATSIAPKADSKNNLKFELKPVEGDSTLIITATDKSGNVFKKEEVFKGVKKPVVDVKVTSDNSQLIINVKHDAGLKKVEYSINGQSKVKEYVAGDSDIKDSTIRELLNYGQNIVTVKATSVEGFESQTFQGQVVREQISTNSLNNVNANVFSNTTTQNSVNTNNLNSTVQNTAPQLSN